MNKIIKIILFLILIFSVSAEKTIASEKIKIGLLVPLTGKNSEIGQSIIKSTRLAINKINNLSIEIIPRDTQSDPKSTLKVAKELSQLGVKIIIGPVFNENLIYLDKLNDITFLSLTNKYQKIFTTFLLRIIAYFKNINLITLYYRIILNYM